MKFNWNGFTEKDFLEYCEEINNGDIYGNDWVGCIAVGDLCFDLIVRESENNLVLDYDLYIGGIDDGYGYGEDNYPYTYGGGGSFNGTMTEFTYSAFMDLAESKFRDYIMYSDASTEYDLVEKANEPLHLW